MEWFRAMLRPISDPGGRLTSVVLTLTVITDLIGEKSTQKQIFLAKREWETTVDALPDIVTIQDENLHQFVHVARDVAQYLRNALEKNRLMAAIEQVSESVVIADSKAEI